ncbi:MAG: hypothetical protein QXL78_03775 [Methanocellales archaeon]
MSEQEIYQKVCYKYCSTCAMTTIHIYIGWGEWKCAECEVRQKTEK